MPDYLSKVVWEKAEDHEYNIPFSFLDSSHVKVKASGVLLTTDDYTISGTTVTITGSYGDGDVIIYRETPGSTQATRNTPENQYVDFANGSVITEADLDNSSLQSIYVAQEAMDKALEAEATPGASGNVPEPDASQDKYILTADGVAGSSVWSSTSDVQTILNVDSAHTASTIPIRDASTPPKILTDVTGDLTGNVTGDVSGSAGTLSPGKTIEITGDVEYISPVYTGSANITAAAEVVKIRGESISEDSPAEGETLRYRDTIWTPETYIPGWAGFAESQTDGTEGKTTAAGDSMDTVPLNTTLANGSISGMTLDDTTDVITVPAGTYVVRWQVPCYSSTASISYLKQSDAATVDGSGFLSDSTIEGTGALVYTGNSDQSQGEVRIVAATTVYWQLQLYTSSSGKIGTSNAAGGRSFYYSTIFVIKEPS